MLNTRSFCDLTKGRYVSGETLIGILKEAFQLALSNEKNAPTCRTPAV
jgi:hypothetical protein